MSYPYKIGDTLFMQQRLQTNEEPPGFKARILDLSDDFISIELPLNQSTGKFGFFLEGSEIEVWFDNSDGLRYQFICYVLGRKKGEIPLTLLTHPLPASITKIQRREFIRVPCFEEGAIHPVKSNTFPPFLAKVIDISGGGMAISLAEQPQIEEEAIIKWWICLPNPEGKMMHPTGLGQLVRIIKPSEKELPYKCTIQFTEVLEVERQKIMRYCFDKQLEIRKKGTKI